MATAKPPVHYGVILYPGFEVLDIAGPLECLNTLNHHKVTPGMTLSIIGRPINDQLPDVPMTITPYDSAAGTQGFQMAQMYKPTHTFSTAPKTLDMILIPGGFGSLPASKCVAEIAFLKEVYPSLKYVLTICTGVGLATSAGLLDGKRATGNKAVWPDLVAAAPDTCWIADARWIHDGNIWTTSGVSAGTDGMIAFLSTVYDDDIITKMVNSMEYNRVTDWRDDPFSKIYDRHDHCPSGKVCKHRYAEDAPESATS